MTLTTDLRFSCQRNQIFRRTPPTESYHLSLLLLFYLMLAHFRNSLHLFDADFFKGKFRFKKTLPDTVDVIDGGLVTTKEQSQAAGDLFRAADVDLCSDLLRLNKIETALSANRLRRFMRLL